MAGLSTEALARVLRRALPNHREVLSANAPKPSTFNSDEPGTIEVYLWTVTPDKSRAGRPAGEHKIQIILPNAERGERQEFDLRAGVTSYLLGWSPAFGVFVLWEIARHQNASYSKNVQVHESLLASASEHGWAVAPPRTLPVAGPEVRCAVHPAHLERLLSASRLATDHGYEGVSRQVFLESSAPDFDEGAAEGDPSNIEEIQNQRRKVYQARLERCRKFASLVLPLYGYSCAICDIQLNVVEAAHIVPVHDPRSEDQPWNGIALCRNHHRLFDRRIALIDENAIVTVDQETIDLLQEIGRGKGLETLVEPYRNRSLATLPSAYASDTTFRSSMRNALRLNYSL